VRAAAADGVEAGAGEAGRDGAAVRGGAGWLAFARAFSLAFFSFVLALAFFAVAFFAALRSLRACFAAFCFGALRATAGGSSGGSGGTIIGAGAIGAATGATAGSFFELQAARIKNAETMINGRADFTCLLPWNLATPHQRVCT
jgi:hypothetical protein